MAEAITLVASPLIEKITNDAYNFFKKSYNQVYGVEDDIDKLRLHLSKVAAVLKDVERCTEKPKILIDWLKNLRDASLDAEDVLETYAVEAALREMEHTAPVAWASSRWNASKNIKKIVERIESINEQRRNLAFDPAMYRAEATEGEATMNYRENHSHRGRREVIGRQEEKEKIVKWLVSRESSHSDERIPVIAITGMAGLGKTTLAQLVYNDERVFKKKGETCHFKKAAWVHVSAAFNVAKILQEIAEILTDMVHGQVSPEFILMSIEKFLDGNPLLLVLDDVWVNDKLAWEVLHRSLITFPKGSKVLVTSRSDAIAVSLGAIHSHHLGMLTETHCWELFCKEVYYNGETHLGEEKKTIGKEIISKCQFLPLAVKLMGGILRGKDIQYWERIKNTDIWDAADLHGDEGLSQLRPFLILSFDDLSPILKECFAYTSIFPKGHMFDKHELVKLWIAQGFIQPTPRETYTLEQLGGDCFDKLCSRSFFQLLEIDRNKRYKMHDLMHDLAKHVSITSKHIHNFQQLESLSLPEDI